MTVGDLCFINTLFASMEEIWLLSPLCPLLTLSIKAGRDAFAEAETLREVITIGVLSTKLTVFTSGAKPAFSAHSSVMVVEVADGSTGRGARNVALLPQSAAWCERS
ncbi:hypothetical protein TcWFU_001148 [Taenia crassiceps]|uniref:Uncharacterized protein n=1 Tax=Taenia crassiceps TaxID=6207 RepID=A0ABR4Q7I2_9CEST